MKYYSTLIYQFSLCRIELWQGMYANIVTINKIIVKAHTCEFFYIHFTLWRVCFFCFLFTVWLTRLNSMRPWGMTAISCMPMHQPTYSWQHRYMPPKYAWQVGNTGTYIDLHLATQALYIHYDCNIHLHNHLYCIHSHLPLVHPSYLHHIGLGQWSQILKKKVHPNKL